MRHTALLTVLLFLGQAAGCAHAGLGATAAFRTHSAMAAGTCAGADVPASRPHTGETPAERCSRHCAQVAQSVPSAAPGPQLAAHLWHPVERLSLALPAVAPSVPRGAERASPRPSLRLLLASLQI